MSNQVLTPITSRQFLIQSAPRVNWQRLVNCSCTATCICKYVLRPWKFLLGNESFNWENSSEHYATLCNIMDQNRIELGQELEISKAICKVPSQYQESKVEKNEIDLLSKNTSSLFCFWYRKRKQNLLGAIKTWPGSWGPKKDSYGSSHIETVGRVLVWSDCPMCIPEMTSYCPSIVLLCRWLNFPNPGNRACWPEMLLMI